MNVNDGLIHLDRPAWERNLAAFADANYRQAWEYGHAAAAHVGAASEHVALVRDSAVRGMADVRVKALPVVGGVVGGGVAYVNGGPLVRRVGEGINEHRVRLRETVAALHAEYVKRRGMVLRAVGTIGDAGWNTAQDEVWRETGFVATTMAAAYRTMMVPLRDEAGNPKTIETIRAGLAQKWRNCLNKAEKQGVTVTVSRDVESMRRFAALYDEFVVRKGIHANHDAAFFLKVQEACEGTGDENGEPHSESGATRSGATRGAVRSAAALTIRLAERDGQLLAGHVASAMGDTCVYLLGATSPAGLTCNAAYLLQWDTIKVSHAAGLAWYDLGGIDPESNPGVFHFKDGMRGADVTAPGPYEAAGAGLRGMMSASSEKLYRTWRERKRKRNAEKGEGSERPLGAGK